ncbi:unnamed protein product [Euphydryas editha]|uniref:Uncharacterized protein n=1 Tax=Euphydryas editha TaxID=104508 RepID=A0AAU9TFN1_EUPED|nr:unnamed protein product [Euphydryas editha]
MSSYKLCIPQEILLENLIKKEFSVVNSNMLIVVILLRNKTCHLPDTIKAQVSKEENMVIRMAPRDRTPEQLLRGFKQKPQTLAWIPRFINMDASMR